MCRDFLKQFILASEFLGLVSVAHDNGPNKIMLEAQSTVSTTGCQVSVLATHHHQRSCCFRFLDNGRYKKSCMYVYRLFRDSDCADFCVSLPMRRSVSSLHIHVPVRVFILLNKIIC